VTDQKLSQLTAATSLASTDLHYATVGGLSRSLTTKVLGQEMTGFVDAKRDHDVAGDGTDEASKINAAIDEAAADGKGVVLPPPQTFYGIGSPLVFKAPIWGQSGDQSQVPTEIRALAGFTGTMMVDFNHAGEGRSMSNLYFNANAQAGVRCFSSTSTGGGGGSSNGYFENLFFSGTDVDTYCVEADSSISESGMLVGSVWVNCRFINVSQAIYAGNLADEVTFIGTRIHMNATAQTDRVIRTEGGLIKFINTFILVQPLTDAGSLNTIIDASNADVEFDHIFVEGTTDAARLFICGSSFANLKVKDLRLNVNYTGASADQAIVRLTVPATATERFRISVNGVARKVSTNDAWDTLFSIFNPGSGVIGPAYLTVNGCDEFGFANMVKAGASSATNANRVVKLHGAHRGRLLHHFYNSSIVGSLDDPQPDQPHFLARLSASTSNDKTGDGTAYTVIPNTEVYDWQGDHNTTTGIFTAPVTGTYHLDAAVKCQNLLAGHTTGVIRIVASNRTFERTVNIGAIRDAGNTATLQISADVDMDASDTASIEIVVSGSTLTVGVTGGTTLVTYFNGRLIA